MQRLVLHADVHYVCHMPDGTRTEIHWHLESSTIYSLIARGQHNPFTGRKRTAQSSTTSVIAEAPSHLIYLLSNNEYLFFSVCKARNGFHLTHPMINMKAL